MSKQQKNESSSAKDSTKTTRQPVDQALQPSPLAQFGDIQNLQRAMSNPGGISPRVVSGLQRSVGNQRVQRMVNSNNATIQQFSGEFAAAMESEQSEEDQSPINTNQQADGQGQDDDDCPDCPKNQVTQRQLDDTGGVAVNDHTSQNIDQESGRGQPLPQHMQTKMQDNLGITDPENINIHTDSKADQLSESLGARAFTSGSDIFFKQGEYNPHSNEGQKLLYHEGWHTQQQGGTSSSDTTQPKMIVNPPDDKYEQEADDAAEQAVQTDAEQQMAAPGTPNGSNGAGDGGENEEEQERLQDPLAALKGAASALNGGAQPGSVAQTANGNIQKEDDDEKKEDEPTEEEIEAEKKDSKDKAKETKDEKKSEAETEGEKKGDEKDTGAGPKVEIPKTEQPPQPEEIPAEFPEPELPVDTDESKFDPDEATDVEPETEGDLLPTWDDLAEDTLPEVARELDYHEALATTSEDDIDLTGDAQEIAEEVEEPEEELDRGQMIGDALKDGALTGLEEGAASLISDQIMQAATAKIPYADGAINLMQLAMDPEAWAQQNVLVIGDNAKAIGDAFSKIGDEDTGWGYAAAVLEAMIAIVDFVKSIIDLVNIILTIILFVLKMVSIIFSALIALIPVPFCIFCWASALIAPNTWILSTAIPILDTVNTAISTIGNMLLMIKFATTPVIMLFRSLDLLTSDADPEKLKEKQANLEGHTASFVQTGVEKAGTKAIDAGTSAASKKVDKRKAQSAEKDLNAMKKGPDESQSDFDTRKARKQEEFETSKKKYEDKYGEGDYDKNALTSELKDQFSPTPAALDFRKKYKTDDQGNKVRDYDAEKGTLRGDVGNLKRNISESRAEAKKKYAIESDTKPTVRKPGSDPEKRIDEANTRQRDAEGRRDRANEEYDAADNNLTQKRDARNQADDNVSAKRDDLNQANQDFQQAKQDAIEAQRTGDTDQMIEANNRLKEAKAQRKQAQEDLAQAQSDRDQAVQEHNEATDEKAAAATRKRLAEEETDRVTEESNKARDDAEQQKREMEAAKEMRSTNLKNLREEMGLDTAGSLLSTGSQGGQRHGPGATGVSSKFYDMFGIDWNTMILGDSTEESLDQAEEALDNYESATTDENKATYANQASQALSSVTEDDIQEQIDAVDEKIATQSAKDKQTESLQAQLSRRQSLGTRAENLGIQIKGSMAHWGEEYNIKKLLTLNLAATGLSGYDKANEKDAIFKVKLDTGPEREQDVTDTEASLEFFFYKDMNLDELSVDPQDVNVKRSGTNEEVTATPDMANKSVETVDNNINVTVPYDVPESAIAQTKPLQRSPDEVDEGSLAAENRISLGQSLGGLIQRAPADEEPVEEMPAAETDEMPAEEMDVGAEEDFDEEAEPAEEMDEEIEADIAEAEEMEAAEAEEEEEAGDPMSVVKLGYEAQLFEQLPHPPEGVVEQVQAAALGYSAVDDEEYELKIQEVQIGAMQMHTQGQLSEIRGIRAMTGTNQQIINKQQEDIDTKLEGQSDMNQQASAKASDAEDNAQQSDAASGFLDKIFANLLAGFGFGSAFGAGGDADTDTMKKGTQDQSKDTQASADFTKETSTITNKWTAETNQVKAGADKSESELQSFDEMKAEEEEDTEEGAAELTEAQSVNEEQQAVVSEEKERLTEEHGSGIEEAGAWAEEHQAIREEIFAMLDEDMEAAAAGQEPAIIEM